MANCNIPNCRKFAPADEPFCKEHRGTVHEPTPTGPAIADDNVFPSRTLEHELGALRSLIKQADSVVSEIIVGLGDEGDRVYLNSTNDVDTLKALAGALEDQVYRIMEAEGD